MSLEWLIPICLFWVVSAVYLGGFALDIEGGSGLQQLLGLVVTFALFLVAWAGFRAGFGRFGVIGQVVVPTLAAVLLLPAFSKGAFRLFGVRIHKAAASH